MPTLDAADAARFRWLMESRRGDLMQALLEIDAELGSSSDVRAAFDRVMAREGLPDA